MATRKEQLTATGFARRRVLGSFLRPGTPNPDQGAPRPARALFAAAVVAVIGLGVAAVVGFMNPKKGDDWQKDLIADSAGRQYVMLDGRLFPVLNMTSARLVLGPAPTLSHPRDSVLSPYLHNVGPAVGIAHVPAAPPKAGELDLHDWAACVTPAGKAVVEVGYPGRQTGPAVLTGAEALLVQDDAGQQWVVDGGMRYRIGDRAAVATAFNTAAIHPRRVPSAWLDGLSAGDVLGVPTISGKFGTALARPAPAGFNRVGMFGKVVGPGSVVAAYYLVTGDGLAVVSPTAYELYEREPRLAQYKFTETVLSAGKVTTDMLVATPAAAALAWPAEPPRFAAGDQDASAPGASVLCAAFAGGFDQQGHAHIAVSLAASLPQAMGPADAAVLVRPGHGVIVREAGSDPATAPAYLVTDTGTRYELVGAAAIRLGYDGVAAAEVPAGWLRLLPQGPPLDPVRAAQPAEQ